MRELLKLCIFSLYIVLFISCTETKQPEFRITGHYPAVPDSTIVLMINQDTDEADSAYILNGTFHFTGHVEYPTPFIFIAQNETERISYFRNQFFFENATILIEFDSGGVTVTGSKSNEVKNAWYDERKLIRNKYDALLQLDTLSSQDSTQLFAYYNELKMADVNFYKNNPNEHFVISQLVYETIPGGRVKELEMSKSEIRDIFELLSDELKNSPKGQIVNRFLSVPDVPAVGEPFVDFTLPDVNGTMVKLSDFKGKYILVDFWASWCAPCRAQNPKLKELRTQFNKQNFEILGVSIDMQKDQWDKALEEDHLPWTNVLSEGGRTSLVSQLYGINGIPDNLLIDPDGIIIQRDIHVDELKALLSKEISQRTQ